MFPTLLNFTKAGQSWSADTELNTGLTLNSYIRMSLSNPADSGRVIEFYTFGAFINANTVIRVYRDVTTNITANTIIPYNQNMNSTNTSVAKIRWDTSGSNISGNRIRSYGIAANSPYEFSKEIIMVYPGQTIGFSAQVTLSLNNSALLHASWVEEALTVSNIA